MEETLRAHLMLLSEIIGRDGGPSRPAIAREALNDNTFFRRLERGENFTIKTFDRVVRWFSDNWPEGADWPADIPRPSASTEAA